MLGVNVYHAFNSSKKKDRKLPKEFYRNHFCAGENHDDFPILESLEEKEFAYRRMQFDQIVFHITDNGQEVFRQTFKDKIKEQDGENNR